MTTFSHCNYVTRAQDVHGHGLGPSHGGVPHHQAGPPGQGGQGGIPQASVRPLVRPQLSMASEKHEPMDPDIKPPMPSEYLLLLTREANAK